MLLAQNFTLIKGKGTDFDYKIVSFDAALKSAGIGDFNVVKVSSILPPQSIINKHIEVSKGSILYVAYAANTIYGKGRTSSAISVGIPQNSSDIGVIMEYSSEESEQEVIDHSRYMVKKAMDSRDILLKEIVSVGIEATQNENAYLTTFAGIALW